MVSTKQLRSFSFVVFMALLVFMHKLQVGNQNLAQYAHRQSSSFPEPTQFNQTSGRFAMTHGIAKERRTNEMIQAKKKVARLTKLYAEIPQSQQSPACYPHFQSISSTNSWAWNNTTKFKRLYFYHSRKAGGTSLAHYFSKVALHHGLQFQHDEWSEAEEPGASDVPTFYVTHMREPVDRSVSHFKYQGRWNCSDLRKIRRRGDTAFLPTEENANKLETWNATGGHSPNSCIRRPQVVFRLGECAVNCYIQWFSGACPEFDVSATEQYQVAKAKMLRYNFVVVLEKLKDAEYVRAVEKFFGVPGVYQKQSAWCENTSHKANTWVPLDIKATTKDRLTKLNKVDIGLYNEMTSCLDDITVNGKYLLPKLDAKRFDTNTSIQVNYYDYEEWKLDKVREKRRKKKAELGEGDDEDEEEKVSIVIESDEKRVKMICTCRLERVTS